MKKNKKDILVFLIFWIIIFAEVITRQLNNLDEIWVFNTARNIANGLLPYKDFNLITTPGIPILCGIILKLLGTELIFMRIIASIIDTLIIFFIYKILNLLKVKKELAFTISMIFIYLFIESFCIDYNFMILLIALIIMYIELKSYIESENIFDYKIKKEILLGIVAGISVTMKHTAGICFLIVFIGYKILAVRNKKEFVQFLKIAFTRFFSAMIPILIMLVYFIYNDILNDFIDYAILGIGEFKNSISYMNLINGDLGFLAVLVPIIIPFALIEACKRNDKILLTLFGYSVSTIIIAYPIADTVHFLIAGTIAIITGLYLFMIWTENDKDDKKEDLKIFGYNVFTILNLIICLAFMELSFYKLGSFLASCHEYNELSGFKYIPVSEDFKNEIQSVDEYILSQDGYVYMVDARAGIYMIPINRYNKNYDMFLIGNIGSKGSAGIIEDLESKDGEILLVIRDESRLNWQTPLDVIDYIKENYNKIGEIESFDIYQ